MDHESELLNQEWGLDNQFLNQNVDVRKSDYYPFHDVPASGQNPGFEKLHSQPIRWSSQRALVLTEQSINQQFEQLHNQEPALQQLYYRSSDGKNWLDAKTYPFSVKILDGVTRAGDQEVFLVVKFKSGRMEPLGLDLTDFKLCFSCNLRNAQSIGPGYNTQLLFKTLNSINSNTIDGSLSMYGKDMTQEQFKASDTGSVKYHPMVLFFTQMMEDNQTKGCTKFGYQIEVGTPWPSSGGYTELSLYNAKDTNNDYSDANYLLWLESPHADKTAHELCPSFSRELAERLKVRATSSLYVEIHQVAEDRIGDAVKGYLKKLCVELDGGTHSRVFNSKQKLADNFDWTISWNSYGQINDIRTSRKWIKTEPDLNPPIIGRFMRKSGDKGLYFIGDWQKDMRENSNRNIYKRGIAKCELSSTIKIDGDCLRYEHQQDIDMNWYLYSSSAPVSRGETTKGYRHSWSYAYIISGGHAWWGPQETGVYSKVNKQDVSMGGLAEWEKTEATESLKRFQNVAQSATLAAEQELRVFWSQVPTVNLKDVRKWLNDAKISIDGSDQSKMSNLDARTRQLLLSVTIAPADGIRITAEEAPKDLPKPAPVESSKPAPVESSKPPLIESSKPPLIGPSKPVEVRVGELKSAVTVAYPGKILPETLITIKLDINPKDNNSLRYRYLEVQFRAKTRGGQLFVPQQSGNAMNVDASVKSETVKTSTQRQESLQSSIKSLRGMGYAVHLVGAKSENGTNLLTVGKYAGASGLEVNVTGLTNRPGQYEMVVVESHVDDRGDILERLESFHTVTVAAA